MNYYDVIGTAGVALIAVALVTFGQAFTGRKEWVEVVHFYCAGAFLMGVAAICQVVAP